MGFSVRWGPEYLQIVENQMQNQMGMKWKLGWRKGLWALDRLFLPQNHGDVCSWHGQDNLSRSHLDAQPSIPKQKVVPPWKLHCARTLL